MRKTQNLTTTTTTSSFYFNVYKTKSLIKLSFFFDQISKLFIVIYLEANICGPVNLAEAVFQRDPTLRNWKNRLELNFFLQNSRFLLYSFRLKYRHVIVYTFIFNRLHQKILMNKNKTKSVNLFD
jgi:hypothetical protein